MNSLYRLFFVSFALFFMADGIIAQERFDPSSALSRMDTAINTSKEEFTPQDGYYIGRAVAAHILGRYTLYTDKPALTHYLNKICGALTVNSAMPEWYDGYHVVLLDSPVPNAFSTPGGHIFITWGIINLASSEDMIAAVIAHEIAHIQLRHSTLEIEHERLVQSLSDLQNEAARIAGQSLPAAELMLQFQQPVHEIVNTLFAKGYSQLQELEADTLALRLLAQAGYNPNSLIEILRVLARSGTRQESSFTNSHPVPAQRIADAEKMAASYRLPETGSFRTTRFAQAIEGIPEN